MNNVNIEITMKKQQVKTLSIIEVMELFSTDEKAVEWLEAERWGDTPVCPHCGGIENISKPASKPFTYWHKDCRSNFTVKTDSLMHSSKIALRHWAVAIYYVLTHRKGVSAMVLSKELKVTYKTAWFMLHRIREGCGEDGAFMLQEVVEADETYLGGKEANKHASKRTNEGRGTVGKQPVFGMLERGGPVKAFPVARVDKETLHGAINKHVEIGTQVFTDDHRGYAGLHGLFYQHGTVKHSVREFVNGMAHTNGIESVWALLKRGYNGTYHHWSAKHCRRYVNEFTFRLNQGNCKVDTIDRMRALFRAMAGKRLRYQDLIA